MTDPRAALALSAVADELVPGIRHDFGLEAERHLAERGVLLVTEERIWEAVLPYIRVRDQAFARRAIAALSGETDHD